MPNRSSFRDLDEAARAELGSRLRAMVEALGSQSVAAQAAQVSVRQLQMYLQGQTAPSFLAVARLAQATGYSLDWVFTGEGPEAQLIAVGVPTPDPAFMGRLVDAIAKAYKAAGVSLPDRDLGAMATEEYLAAAPLGATDDEQITVARMVRTKHERRLATENRVVRKRGA
jgi:transcriptional regulator with XRE-family HTH domain